MQRTRSVRSRSCNSLTIVPFILGAALTLVRGSGAEAATELSEGRFEETLWFQGYVRDELTGDPLDAQCNIEFWMYTTEVGGSSVWNEQHSDVVIDAGWFGVPLGSISSLSAIDFSTPPYYLEIEVCGQTMSPRLQILSVPSALSWKGGEVREGATFRDGLEVRAGNLDVYQNSGIVFRTEESRAIVGTLDTGGLFLQGQTTENNVLEIDAGTAGNVRLERDSFSNESSAYLEARSLGGYLGLRTDEGVWAVELDADNPIWRSTRIHPDDASKAITYAALEGPEAGVFVRGEATLAGGFVRVELPEHFAAVTEPSGITVQVTPLAGESLGLAVVRQDNRSFDVRELHGGTGNYDFSYLVHAVRAGQRAFAVVHDLVQ